MSGTAQSKTQFTRLLLVAAAPIEAEAALAGLQGGSSAKRRSFTPWMPIAHEGVEIVQSGLGKANAAGAAGHLADADRHDAILSVGIAGTLNRELTPIGSIVIASGSVFADEGLETPEGYSDCAAMGFPLGDFAGSEVPVSPEFALWLCETLSPLNPRQARIATVSTCSGTNARAEVVRQRTEAVAEAMEGAAVGLVAHRLRIPFAEIRVISNTTGDRKQQVWDIPMAIANLNRVIGLIAQRLRQSVPGA